MLSFSTPIYDVFGINFETNTQYIIHILLFSNLTSAIQRQPGSARAMQEDEYDPEPEFVSRPVAVFRSDRL
jgi:hypothetical protein